MSEQKVLNKLLGLSGKNSALHANYLYRLQHSNSKHEIRDTLIALTYPSYESYRDSSCLSDYQKKYLHDAEDLKVKLKDMSLSRLKKRVAEELEPINWWSEGKHEADYNYWLKMDFWQHEEAVILAHNLDPRTIKIETIKQFSSFIDKAKSICEMLDTLLRTVQYRQLHILRIEPSDFIKWCNNKGFDLPKKMKLNTLEGSKEASGDKYPEENSSQGKPKQREQEEKIIQSIQELGYDPLALPSANGTSGVKAKVKDRLDGEYPFDKPSAFKNTWERLRSNKEIKDQN